MLTAAALCAVSAYAQQSRPDAGTLLEPQRQLPTLPAPGGSPGVQVQEAPPAAPVQGSVRITPAAFRIEGNTLYGEADLLPLVAGLVGQPTDMRGLLGAADRVRQFYRERGYLLTEAYLPEQRFPATGGTVVIRVLEARVGKVNVQVDDPRVSSALANAIVRNNLRPGSAISVESLEKPVLLLRDLAGVNATATVQPGASPGEGDVTMVVKGTGAAVDGLVGADNFGVRYAGQNRLFAVVNWNNPTGHGDVLSVRLQATDQSNSDLYRIAYATTLTGAATRFGATALRTDYALGGPFAALGASGRATIYGLSATQPFVRTRAHNLLGALAIEHKDLVDRTTTPASDGRKRVNSVRASVLGNFTDRWAGPSFSSYSLSVTGGKLDIDPASLALDQSPTGLRTAGSFSKVNLELQRTTAVSANGRISAGLQAQAASKNLTSAEKFGLGGPYAVRGYGIGEGIGDSGVLATAEYRHQLTDASSAVPLAGSVFYDWGHVTYNADGAPFATASSDTLRAAGLGLTAGNVGNYQVSAHVAWRLSRAALTDPDRRPRVWVSLQKWL
ncbi:MAG TPA: ShlB/FhaC/HecB family hemolysin secretion/activation protein [Ramlibacter sp.]